MRFDRDAALKNADKALKANKVDQAIAEYERVVEHQPRDLTSANMLGDLYMRAGKTDAAIAQYTRIADQLFEDGFLPKASALLKKIVKIRPDDEEVLLRLAHIAAKQRLLADARTFFSAVASKRRARGDQWGADDVLVELADVEGADMDARLEGARVFLRREQPDLASERLRNFAIDLLENQKPDDAVDVLREAVHLIPGDRIARRQLIGLLTDLGQTDEAEAYLTRDVAAGDPPMLFTVAKAELESGRLVEGREDLRAALSDAAMFGSAFAFMRQIASKNAEAGFVAADALADAAIVTQHVDHAVDVMRGFLELVPSHVAGALRLVEICLEQDLTETLPEAQGMLAAAYRATGQHEAARQIADDLAAGDPFAIKTVVDAPIALEPIASAPRPAQPAPNPPPPAPPPEPEPVAPAPVVDLGQALPQFDVYVYGQPIEPEEPGEPGEPGETEDQLIARLLAEESAQDAAPTPEVLPEIDLTASLDRLDEAPAPQPPALEDLFASGRAGGRGDEQARAEAAFEEAELAAALRQVADAERLYAEASNHVRLRFKSAAALGRLLRDEGRLAEAIEWFERATEVPAPDSDSGHALLYDLGDALEQHGESMRALGIFMELNAEAGDYRGIAARVDRLARAEIGG